MSILIGSIKKTHRYKGALNISINNNNEIELIENCINKKEFVFISIDNIQVPFFITQKVKVLNNKSILIFVDDIFNEYEAKKYVNYEIFVENECFNNKEVDKKTIINYELIGFLLVDVNIGELGNVFNFINNPTNPLIVVKNKENEILIPLNSNFIIEINNETKIIKTNLPEGLINLND